MSVKVKGGYSGGAPVMYDTVSGETTFSGQPLFFEDEFVGAGHTAGVPVAGSPVAGYPWVKKIVGAAPPTVAPVSNAGGGQMACTLAATSEKEEATLYMNDNLSFDVTKGLIWEARVNVGVLPSAGQVQMVWGLQSAWIDGPDNGSYYLGFGLLGNGNLIIRSKDGVTTNAISAASIAALLTTDWHVFKVDATDVTNVQFYIDGNAITGLGTVAFAATGANAILQGYASAYKASGTGVGTLTLDNMQIRTNRQ
jgi:hypothetical protein